MFETAPLRLSIPLTDFKPKQASLFSQPSLGLHTLVAAPEPAYHRRLRRHLPHTFTAFCRCPAGI